MNNLNIGKAVNALLTANTALTTAVGSKIFPVVAQYDTKFPFVVYSRRDVTPNYTKCGVSGESVTVEVIAAAKSYAEAITIANNIRSAMELKSGTFGGTTIRQIYLQTAREAYNATDDIFIQTLTFNILI